MLICSVGKAEKDSAPFFACGKASMVLGWQGVSLQPGAGMTHTVEWEAMLVGIVLDFDNWDAFLKAGPL